MKVLKFFPCLVLVFFLLTTVSCSKRQVQRIATDSTTDISGRWNDTDSRLVSQEMIATCLSAPWNARHVDRAGKRPIIIVGVLKNKTSEHIAISTFIGDIERSFINSAQVTVVASAEEREQIRDERTDQQTYSSEETVKNWGREQGADYMLGGIISSIVDQEGGKRVVFYQVDLTLIDLEDNSKVWLGQKKIKKYIGKGKLSL